MRRGLFHPSRSRLREWLDTGTPAGVGEHVEHCDACADRLEQIDQADSAPSTLDGSGPLRAALAELIAAPDDLTDRVLIGLDGRRRAERELALFAGLFSIGIETAQLMIEEPDVPNRNEQPHDERRIVDRQEGNES